MKRKNPIFDEVTNGLDKSVQATLNYFQHKEMMRDEYNKKIEREKLKKEIIQEVLNSISATVDVTDIVEKIEELDKAIKKIGK